MVRQSIMPGHMAEYKLYIFLARTEKKTGGGYSPILPFKDRSP
jgi:hypothetical protein